MLVFRGDADEVEIANRDTNTQTAITGSTSYIAVISDFLHTPIYLAGPSNRVRPLFPRRGGETEPTLSFLPKERRSREYMRDDGECVRV